MLTQERLATERNGILAVCPNFENTVGMTEGGATLVVVLKGLMGMQQVAARLLLTFCGANSCGIG